MLGSFHNLLIILVVFPCLVVVKSWITTIPNTHILFNQLFAIDPYIFSHLLAVNFDVGAFSFDPSSIIPKNIDTLKTIETITASIKQTIDPITISNQIGDNINNVLQNVGESTLTGFNNILDENPKLKLSTSAFVMDYYTNTFIPKYTYTTGVISNGPLAQGIKNLLSQSPNNIVEAVATKTYTILDSVKPISVNIISGITTPVSQVVAGTANGVLNTIGGVVTYIKTDGIKQPLVDHSSSSSSIDLEAIAHTNSFIQIPSISIPDLVDKSVSFVSSVINTIPTALNKASTSFSNQLAQKATILTTNTVNFANTLSSSIPKLIVNSWNSAGDVLVEKASSIPTTVIAPIKNTLIASLETLANIVNAYSNKINAASTWKLFSDDNHWQTGYWEQQVSGLQRIIQDKQVRDIYTSRISDAFSNFDDRFIAQYTAKRNEYKDFDTKVVNIGSNMLHVLKSLTDKSINLLNTVEKESVGLIQDTKSYVDDFILSGNEL